MAPNIGMLTWDRAVAAVSVFKVDRPIPATATMRSGPSRFSICWTASRSPSSALVPSLARRSWIATPACLLATVALAATSASFAPCSSSAIRDWETVPLVEYVKGSSRTTE